MICYLKGALVEKHPTRLVMDVAGVGYELLIPLSSYDRLPSVGATCRVEVHDYVREDQHTLYGFMTAEEKRMFGMLMSVTGIGPKLALSALSALSVRDLTAAVAQSDLKRLNAISGVGRKLAERMVIELRDKLSAGEALEAVAGETPRDARARDGVLALVSLGHKQADARVMVSRALEKLPAEASVEDLIREALAGTR